MENSKRYSRQIALQEIGSAGQQKCTNPNYTIIDLREAHQEPKLQYNSVLEILLSEIEGYQSKLKKDQPIVLFCQSGLRSKKALTLFVNNGFTNIIIYKKEFSLYN